METKLDKKSFIRFRKTLRQIHEAMVPCSERNELDKEWMRGKEDKTLINSMYLYSKLKEKDELRFINFR